MIDKNRIIVLDTETTGINPQGLPHVNHRVIEIGAVEIVKRRFTGNNFHVYIQPNRSIEHTAFKIHGITNDFLSNKPIFKNIADEFLSYIKNSQLVIHNAPFDVAFINQEYEILNKKIKDIRLLCTIIDTLKIARKLFPGKKNSLDALCTRYKIKKSHRNLHSAIIDAKLLGKLYLLMTGGQESMSFYNIVNDNRSSKNSYEYINSTNRPLKILKPTQEEIKLHKKYLKHMIKNNLCLWDQFFK